jgi:ankyrin repeat protein
MSEVINMSKVTSTNEETNNNDGINPNEESNMDKDYRLPEICIKKYSRNSPKEKELIDLVEKGNVNKIYDLLWNETLSLNVRKDYYGTDLLSLATQKEHNDIVKILMKMNLDPRLKNNYGVTPVHWAANNGNEYLIKEFCKRGLPAKDLEKKDIFGSTPLHFAALKNNGNIVHFLISYGVNPTVINNDGKKASDITTDITLKKYLIEEENRYIEQHYKKKSKKKKGKKKGKGKSGSKKGATSAEKKTL